MSGATRAVDTVFQQAKADVVATSTAAQTAQQGFLRGDSFGTSVGVGVKKFFGPGTKLIKDIGGGIMGQITPKKQVPESAAPVDPVAVQAESDKAKARAKRQSEINILTDRPGRGGTILTDQYQYKV